MPPLPTWISGHSSVMRFLGHRVRQAVADHRFRTEFVEASGRPAIGFYRKHEDGDARFFALQVLEVRHGRIAVIDHFMGEKAHLAFFAAGLPRAIAGS